MDDSTLHIILSSGLSAVGVLAGWNLLTLIRIDKQVAVMQVSVNSNGTLPNRIEEVADRLEKLIERLDERIEKLEAR